MASLENSFLAEQIALLDKILAASTDHIYVLDRVGRFWYASPAGLTALGLEAAALSGKTWRELNFPAEVMEHYDGQRESVFQTGVPITGETRFPTVQGFRYYEYVISPMVGADGEISAVVNTSRDITERKQTEATLRQLTEELEARVTARTEELTALNQSLRIEIVERQKAEQAFHESEMRFQSLVEAMFEGVVVQENGRIIDANPGFAEMFGYSLEEVMGKSAVDFLTPESLEIVLRNMTIHYESPYEVIGIKKDGTLINLEIVGKQSLYQGRSVRVSAARDITDRKQAELALKEKEQQLQQLSDSMPQFVWISNAQGETEYVNRQWLEYSGLTVEQSRNAQKVREFYHPEEVQTILEHWAIAQATQHPFEMEARLRRASDGAYRWFLMRSTPVLDDQGQVLRWYGTSTDIHDRKIAQLNEQFLKDLDLRLRQLSDAEAMVWEAISRIGPYLNVERCVWHEVNVPEDRSIVKQDWRRQADISSVVGVRSLSESILPDMITQFQSGQPAVVSDVTTHPYTAPFGESFAEMDIRAFVGIPCLYQGHWVAMLAINARTVQAWRSDQVALLQEVVARLWSLIEQTRAMQALRESEERLRLAMTAADQGLYDVNVQTGEVTVNDSYAQMLGYDPKTFQESAMAWRERLHPDDRDSVNQIYEAYVAGDRKDYRAEFRLWTASGDWKWILSLGKMVAWDRDGKPLRMLGTHTDISDRKRAEQELQSVYDSLNLALAAAEMGTWDLDLMTDTARRNLRHDQIFGYDTLQPTWGHEIARRHALPEDLPKFDEGFQQGLITGEVQFEARVTWPDQSIHWINVLGRVYYDEQHQPVRLAGVVMDISERKQIEAERHQFQLLLQEKEALYRQLFESNPQPMWVYDRETLQFLAVNPAAIAKYGYSESEFLSMTIADIRPPEEVPNLLENIARVEEGLDHAGIWQHYLKDGRLILVDIVSHTLEFSGRRAELVVAHDITDRKRAEEALQEREALLHLFAQYAPAGIAMFDREMRYVMASQRWADDYYHGSLEAMIGRSHYELFPEMPERWRQMHQRCLAGAIEKCDEDLFVRADGRQQWTRWETHPWYTATDEIGGIIIFAEDITQRKQSETAILQLNQELQQKVTELQTLLEVIPIGIGIAEDPECQHIRVNPAFANALGIPPTVNASLSASEEERPTTFKVYQNEREMQPEELPLQYAATHGVEIRDLEVDVVWQDGTTVTLLEYAAPLLDESGRPRGSVGAFLNITDRKRAEEALRDREQQLKLALQAAKAGAWTWKLATNRLYWSDEYYRVFGLEPGSVEPSYENGFSRLHPEDREWVERETAAAIAQGKNTNIEHRILLPDGTIRWVVGIGQMFYDGTNQPDNMAGIVVDITERKQVEAELRKREELYRALASNFPNGAVHIFDPDLRYLLSDGTEMRKVGLSQAQLEGHLLWEAVPPETAALLEPLYRAALAGETTSAEIAFANQIYQIYTLPLRNEEGEIFAGLSMSQNVTLLKQAEQTLRTARDELERQVQERTRELRQANERLAQREREFRTLVENTPDVITRHDRQHRYLYINPASTQISGIPPEVYLGKKPSELGYPQEIAQFWEASLEAVFVTGEMRIDEFEVMNQDEPRSYQVYVVPEREADQSIVSVMTIARDVTCLRQAEASTRKLAEELQRSNQELEQFAYVASHDLQEPLRAVTSFTQMLAKRYQGQLDAKADTYIEFIVDGATRMQQLIRDLLAYSRAGRYELKLQPIDFNALVQRVKKDLQVAIAENQAIITADSLPTITGDPNQMAHLLQNLIGNSLKYRSDANPRIHLSATILPGEATTHSSPDTTSPLTVSSGEWLFSLQDNGIGIEPRYAERIFGIFQRLHTSDEYSGTGLGLAICRKIIERHEGRIWVESQLGQGATFFFTIPLSLKVTDLIKPET